MSLKRKLTYLDRMTGSPHCGDRKGEGEGGSMAEPAFHRHLALKQLNQPANQGQAKTSPLIMSGVEAAKEVSQPFGFDAAARVAHRKMHFVLLFLGFEQDRAILGSVAHCIAHQIVHNAA